MLASLLGGRDQAALASAVAKYAGLGQGAGGSCWPRSTTMLSPSAVHMSMRKVKCVRVPAFASTKPQVAAAQRVVAPAA